MKPAVLEARQTSEEHAMRKKIIHAVSESTPTWESLETLVRQNAQDFIQRILEEEVNELLGRGRYERAKPVDCPQGSRNGHGKPRKLTMSSGTITVRRPRVRNLEQRFESRILPLFKRRTEEVGNLIPELYAHGLAQGDFDLALRGLLGDGAPLSASTVARLKEKWQADKETWDQRDLSGLEVVYLWVDGVYVKAGLEKLKSCVFVAVAGLRDGSKVVVALSSGHRESKASWSDFLRDLKKRGMNCPRVIIGDGNLGIWGAATSVFPEADEQRCWNHRIVNAVDKLPKKLQPTGRELLKRIPYAKSLDEAVGLKKAFQTWCAENDQKDAAKVLDEDWERMVTFYRYPKEHWRHLRTSNVVESPFAALRLRTDAAKRFKKVDNAIAVIWKTLLIVEQRFRRLNAPDLLDQVFQGARYEDGVMVEEPKSEKRDAA